MASSDDGICLWSWSWLVRFVVIRLVGRTRACFVIGQLFFCCSFDPSIVRSVTLEQQFTTEQQFTGNRQTLIDYLTSLPTTLPHRRQRHPDANETSATTLWLSRQLTWRDKTPGLRLPEEQLRARLIKRNTHRNTEHTETTDDKPTDDPTPVPITASLPYIRGASETIARILWPYNIRVAHKPITTVRDLLTNVKDKEKPDDRQGQFTEYLVLTAERRTSEKLAKTWKRGLIEHKRATTKGDITNHISEHHRKTEHDIDWDSAECVIHSTNYYQRITLESWYTNSEREPFNRCQQLPAPHNWLIEDSLSLSISVSLSLSLSLSLSVSVCLSLFFLSPASHGRQTWNICSRKFCKWLPKSVRSMYLPLTKTSLNVWFTSNLKISLMERNFRWFNQVCHPATRQQRWRHIFRGSSAQFVHL